MFKSKAQIRYMYSQKPELAKEFSSKTKNFKDLPERVKKAMCESFTKIAGELFNPNKIPPVPSQVIQRDIIQSAKNEKTKGMSPVEHRNELTSRRTGIIQKNKETTKVI